MTEPEIWTFFYGSYINLDVLKEVNYTPGEYEIASLPGFDITIRPLANLVRSDRHTAYGIVATGTHTELTCLYEHAEDVLGGRYLPEAVLVQTRTGRWMPALSLRLRRTVHCHCRGPAQLWWMRYRVYGQLCLLGGCMFINLPRWSGYL